MRATALIFGADGFDPDVARNISALYSELGLYPFRSREMRAATVLCIERTPTVALEIPRHYQRVHIFDYVCADNAQFLAALEARAGLSVYVPSAARRATVLQAAPHLEPFIHVALPPVRPSLWIAKRGAGRSPDIVHIGHYKPSYNGGTDTQSRRFLEAIVESAARVWGNGWQSAGLEPSRVMGRLPLKRVSSVYSTSSLALGMMYPFQRELTISGRMWHAPLNGCTVFSEALPAGYALPGNTLVDYGEWLDAGCRRPEGSPGKLADEALRFWLAQYEAWIRTMSSDLNSSRDWSDTRSPLHNLASVIAEIPRNAASQARFHLAL